MLTQQQLHKTVHYNPETGVFTRLISKYNPSLVGKAMGCLDSKGYVRIGVDGNKYQAHRLAFLYMLGSAPEYVDHKNQDKADNVWANLRPATKSQNGANSRIKKNNTSLYRGVSWHKGSNKWVAQLGIMGKRHIIGYFACKHHAFCEYVLASRKEYGAFSAV